MYIIFIVLVLIFIVLNSLLNKKKNEVKKEEVEEKLPYEKIDKLLSEAELNFYLVLKNVIDEEKYYICPKVRLADIIKVGETDKRQKYFNKIRSKHIDFLICDNNSFEPIFAIELDDKSHERKDRVERDSFVDEALMVAGIDLIRFKVKSSYSLEEIKKELNEKGV